MTYLSSGIRLARWSSTRLPWWSMTTSGPRFAEAAALKIDAAIDYQMGDGLIVERIVSRRVCSNCGATYNLVFVPPRNNGVCDRCGGEVIQRVDDHEDVIKTRVEAYRTQTAPLVEFYSRRGLLCTVDASQEAQAVERQVVGIIEALG